MSKLYVSSAPVVSKRRPVKVLPSQIKSGDASIPLIIPLAAHQTSGKYY